ncbi:MAG: YlxR family protein [Syntrophorhabdaceae bacterium]|nr:YlxR family protein [Syntrophorhabdaceae bacterium]
MQCGLVTEKRRLLRIAGRPGSAWVPDQDGRLPGRGIYLCREGNCIELFVLRIQTRKGGARWKMGEHGVELAERLAAIR